jgi:predicted PurR-regulated permease PerM
VEYIGPRMGMPHPMNAHEHHRAAHGDDHAVAGRAGQAPSSSGGWVAPGVRTASEWAWRLTAIGLALFGLVLLLQLFANIVIALVVSLLLAALLHPVVDRLSLLMPRPLASLLGMLLALAVVVGLLALVAQQTANGFPSLRDQATQGAEEIRDWLRTGPLNLDVGSASEYVQSVQDAASANRGTLISGALGAATTVSHLVEGFFITLFATFFFLASGRRIWSWLLSLLPRRSHQPVDDAARASWVTLSQYVRATLLVAMIDGVGIGVGAAVLSVPLAVPLGVLVFLGAFIPIVGAFLTGALAVLVALVAQGPFVALLMLGVVVLVQQVEAHGLQPFLLGRAVSVHPLAVILSIAAGATLAGIVGALFAVPSVAVANTFISTLHEGGRRSTRTGDPSARDDEPLAGTPPPTEPGGADVEDG